MPSRETGIFLLKKDSLQKLASKDKKPETNSFIKKKDSLILGVFRTLSLQEFSFPFSDTFQIREALNLKTLPFSSASGGLEVFPTITSRDGKNTGGIAWFVSKNELEKFEKAGSATGGRNIYLPVPLVFSGLIDGTGAGIWADEENLCSVIFGQEGIPLFYGWRSRKNSSVEDYRLWLEEYARSTGLDLEQILVLDELEHENISERLTEMLINSLSKRAFLKDINISRSELDTELYLEKVVRYSGKFLAFAALAGLILMGSSLYRYYKVTSTADWLDSRSEEIYREVFGQTGRVVDPLSQARGRVRDLQTSDSGMTLDSFLGILGRSVSELENSAITLDVLRYSGDTVDLGGTTMDMTSVQAFQSSLEQNGIEPAIGDIQQVPGGGLRFTMVIGW